MSVTANGSNYLTSDLARVSYAIQGILPTGNDGFQHHTMEDGQISWVYNVSGTYTGLTTTNNVNGILTLGTAASNYHQLGFSSNGNIYHHTVNGAYVANNWVRIVKENGATSTAWDLKVNRAVGDKNGLDIDANYLKLSGGTMTGGLHLNKIYGISGVSYGQTLPLQPTAGEIFFQIGDPWYELPPGGAAGQALIKHSANDRDVEWGAVGGIMSPTTTTTYYVSGSQYTTQNSDPALFNTNIYVSNNVLFGAAWNDYAEYRKCNEKIEPGRCIIENGDGSLSLSTKRMQSGAEIVSDTFGFAIGKTAGCDTPIAVSGRVLAYMYEDLKNIKIGAPVCSGPNGTVSQMTTHEARKYPWLIIGTISSIPTEEEWGENKIKVNGRVWIRVR